MRFKETLKETKKTIFVILILILGFGPAKIAKAGSSLNIPVTYTRLIVEVQNPTPNELTQQEAESHYSDDVETDVEEGEGVSVLRKRKRS